jgi:hypothetical protein
MGTRVAYQVRDVIHPIPSTTSAGAEPEGSRNRIKNGESNRFPKPLKTHTNG